MGTGYERSCWFTLPALPASVSQARRALADHLTYWGLPYGHDLGYALKLVASELITNSVEHAAVLSPEVSVTCTVHDGWLWLGVRDRHPYRPVALLETVDDTSGRGLLIVRNIVTEFGGQIHIEAHPDGKTLWVILPWPVA
ncbi:ATP-binding protein [Streptomyces sp. SID3343]|uniref:ATP-binding protein n=1 Tax=Streptomyces sp. SID3343 TaxID=2690260 RepID=UPI001369AE38|nr:ATP-binding protein [Streptomyces sp. SID3343]MYW01191.1 ATP-binding protein [Streptomyces sp. SID3343]